jgi:Spy/CpxP family protein refolding chaperone
MKKSTLTAVSTVICSLSIAATIIVPSFCQQATAAPVANQPAATGANPQAQLIEQLKITKTQQVKLAKVEQTVKQKIFEVLTPEQKEQVRMDMKQGKSSSLKFTAEQQTQVKAIQTVAVSERDAILTSEQKQKLQQIRKQYTGQS